MNIPSCYETFQGPLGQFTCLLKESLSTSGSYIHEVVDTLKSSELVKSTFEEIGKTFNFPNSFQVTALTATFGLMISRSPYASVPFLITSLAGFYSTDERTQLIAGTLFSSIIFGNILCHRTFNDKKTVWMYGT